MTFFLRKCTNGVRPFFNYCFIKCTQSKPYVNESAIKVPILNYGHHRSLRSSAILSFKSIGKPREFDAELEEVDLQTSQNYVESEAYKTTYGDEPVWIPYRRNFKGQFSPKLTRPACIKDGKFVTGNPCPICRDRYLIIHYEHPKLLKQFVSPHTDEVLPLSKTQLCQEKHLEVEVAVEKSRMHGFLPFFVPHRDYDYSDYYDFQNKS